jgi:hypothetical protein
MLGGALYALRSSRERSAALCAARELPELSDATGLLSEPSGDLGLLGHRQTRRKRCGALRTRQQRGHRSLVQMLLLTAHGPVEVGEPAGGNAQLGPRAARWPAGQPRRRPFHHDSHPVRQVTRLAGRHHPGRQEHAE